MRRRLLIVHNPHAGTRQRTFLAAVRRALERAGAQSHIAEAQGVAQDEEIARAAARSEAWDCIVAAGGDSTVRGVACGLIGGPTPLGIIPVGTGNVLAREIGVHCRASALAATLLHGPAVPIGVGRADGTPFLAMAGAGYDADVLLRLNMTAKRAIGRLAYGWPMLCQLVHKPTPFEVIVDEGAPQPATWVIVTRAAHYGGSFIIAKDQMLTGSGFHAVIANARGRRGLIGVLLAIARGRLGQRADVSVVACSRIGLKAPPTVAAQIDGERLGSVPREITLGRETLHIVVPPSSPLAATQSVERAA